MRGGAKERFFKEEQGFTLPEMLVTMMIMIIVLFALYGIFDMSIRVFAFGSDKVEAVENARLGLERMEREMRAAYPVNGANSTPRYRFFNANGVARASPPAQMPPTSGVPPAGNQITFGNELNNALQSTGNGKIDCNPGGYATVSETDDTPCEYITYKLSQSGSTRTLLRNDGVNGSVAGSGGDPVVEFVKPPDTTVPIDPDRYGLRFTYLTSGGVTATTDNGTVATDIARARIELQIDTNGDAPGGGTQTLTTEVELRN